MKLLACLFIFVSIPVFSQTDWMKWGKADYSYQVEQQSIHRNYSFESTGVSDFVGKTFLNTYWFFISDVDGDNCPFHPTCSSFLAQSIKETNIFQGTLMFFDRFTRDMNIFRSNHYPRVSSGRYYDPPSLYTLIEEKINFIPSSEVVSEK